MCCETGCFAMQNSRFRNAKAQLSLFNRIIFTKRGLFFSITFEKKGKADAQ